ncbi:hypothetical protein L9F63_011776 [Diploptera punctata]|uniref:Cytochrome P450 n=1 Tax=Diploptera punctata TaxID=6984 RepID=A0AAD8EPR9_DIPPU|nr:hypothetical protein L9F63_011776 [Diploptera punctata]
MIYYVLTFLLSVVLILYAFCYAKTRQKMVYSELIPGPPALPIFGNILLFGMDPRTYFNKGLAVFAEYGTTIRVWFGPHLTIGLSDPKHIEVLLNSQKWINKAFVYNFLKPWLGSGLLTSTGQHWKKHRKILTSTFHFKILESYLEVFDKNVKILLNQLSKETDGTDFDIYPYINLYTLDNICETAMGVSVNAQIKSNSKYVKAVHSMGDALFHRLGKPLVPQ